MTKHIFGHRGLGHIDAQQTQFAVYSWRTRTDIVS